MLPFKLNIYRGPRSPRYLRCRSCALLGIPFEKSLALCLHHVHSRGRVCALKGVQNSMYAELNCADLPIRRVEHTNEPSVDPWCFPAWKVCSFGAVWMRIFVAEGLIRVLVTVCG